MDGLAFLAIWFLGWFVIGVGIIALVLKVINHVKEKINTAYEEDIDRQKVEQMDRLYCGSHGRHSGSQA